MVVTLCLSHTDVSLSIFRGLGWKYSLWRRQLKEVCNVRDLWRKLADVRVYVRIRGLLGDLFFALAGRILPIVLCPVIHFAFDILSLEFWRADDISQMAQTTCCLFPSRCRQMLVRHDLYIHGFTIRQDFPFAEEENDPRTLLYHPVPPHISDIPFFPSDRPLKPPHWMPGVPEPVSPSDAGLPQCKRRQDSLAEEGTRERKTKARHFRLSLELTRSWLFCSPLRHD